MLPHSLFEWWFEPWRYAPHLAGITGVQTDSLGLRDGYRLWCSMHGIEASIPEKFDGAWSVVADTRPVEMRGAARLFGGLTAAREQDLKTLSTLPAAERKWCLAVAATQPLRACSSAGYAPEDPIEARGFVELGRRLEQTFPGMWTRVRLMLPPDLAQRVSRLMESAMSANDPVEASAARAQRCWRLCRDYVRQSRSADGTRHLPPAR